MYLKFTSPKEITYHYSSTEIEMKWFGPISPVNILIGANNCGKSKFMRSLVLEILRNREINGQLKNANSTSTTIISECISLQTLVKTLQSKLGCSDHYEIKLAEDNQRRIQTYVGVIAKKDCLIVNQSFFKKVLENTKHILLGPNKIQINTNQIASFRNIIDVLRTDFGVSEDKNLVTLLMKVFSLFIKVIENPNFEQQEKKFQKIGFIPIPRTMRRFGIYQQTNNGKTFDGYIDGNFIEENFIKDYDFNGKYSENFLSVHTGSNLYNEILMTRNGKKEQRKLLDEFEEFLNSNFFNCSEFDIVAKFSEKEPENRISIFMDSAEQPIYELGDGIQALIMILLPLYLCPNNSLFFIEEPELHLHPRYQQILIREINKKAEEKNLTVFLTTQSNHFLDVSLGKIDKLSIFSFKKVIEGKDAYIQVDNVLHNDTNILDLLGVKNASVFMSNCTIWVEGITDRRYIRKYLEAYYDSDEFSDKNSKFHEGIHYSFIEYAGANIVHYLFSDDIEKDETDKIIAQFVSNRIFLIADKDKGKDKKHEELTQYNRDNFHYHCLDCCEIENLISECHLTQIIGQLKQSVLLKTDLIKYESYQYVNLGKYLEEISEGKKSFAAKSGTLSSHYKKEFCEKFMSIDVKWNKMSEPAHTLVRELYAFIAKHNDVSCR